MGSSARGWETRRRPALLLAVLMCLLCATCSALTIPFDTRSDSAWFYVTGSAYTMGLDAGATFRATIRVEASRRAISPISPFRHFLPPPLTFRPLDELISSQ